MSNYPLGAIYDPRAPFNEPLPEETKKQFELDIKGKLYISSYSEEELNDKINKIRWTLESLIDHLDIEDDCRVDDIFAEVW